MPVIQMPEQLDEAPEQSLVSLSPEQWEALKLASVSGVEDEELAKRFGITTNFIRVKRCRDELWKAAYQERRKASNNGVIKGGNSALLAKKVASTIQASASDLSQNNLLLANQMASKLLSRASGASEAVPLDTVADIEKAVKIASIAGKWNQPTVAINQAFAFGDAGESENGVVIETEEGEDGPVIECES